MNVWHRIMSCFKMLLLVCLIFLPIQSLSLGDIKLNKILEEFDDMLKKKVNNEGLFDGIGSIDVGVFKRQSDSDDISPVFVKSFGKAQVSGVAEKLGEYEGKAPMDTLATIAKNTFPKTPDVIALNNSKRNIYRIASNTKTFIGVLAHFISRKYGLDLNTTVHPRFINLTTLGFAHSWNDPSESNGYLPNSNSSSYYISRITFNHLLKHTSGLSRESKKGSLYGYGSSRTSTPRCPPEDSFQGEIICNTTIDNNWRQWAQHIVSYMMPNCGYQNYNEFSDTQKDCSPGKYFHYSNAGYSILALALDNYLSRNHSLMLEQLIEDEIIRPVQMNDTKTKWVEFSKKEQKERTTHGCHGGKSLATCNQTRALTDYADRGMKTPPGGMWSTVTDLGYYLLRLRTFNITFLSSSHAEFDEKSEEDPTQFPHPIFRYTDGWYVADNFSCLPQERRNSLYGAWGTVPGFTSYMIANEIFNKSSSQFAVVMLRSYNYAGRFNLGNQARRLLWRLLNPDLKMKASECPVVEKDNFAEGDKLLTSNDFPVNIKVLKVLVE